MCPLLDERPAMSPLLGDEARARRPLLGGFLLPGVTFLVAEAAPTSSERARLLDEWDE